ncbi:MAG: ERF family protein [Rhodobacteraceae bacterium]|nr:ERF family protein [Paracoccaceae bacterium]
MNEVTKMEVDPKVVAYEGGQQVQASGALGVIEHILRGPEKIDIENMQALLKMRAEEEERIRRISREDRDDDARRAWLFNFSKVQSEIGIIARGRSNEHTKSRYADLADIERAVTPVLTAHGFSTTAVPIPCDLDGHIRIRLTIGHADGHEKVYEDDFPLDAAGTGGKVNKTPIQAKGSTQTYGRRYLKASALDLAFGDDNDGNQEGRPPKTVSGEQYIILRDLIGETGTDEVKFHLAHGHTNPEQATLQEFPAHLFEKAKQQLERKRSASNE